MRGIGAVTGNAGRSAVVAGALLLVAAVGLAVSWSAPYRLNDDEVVYLIGALQARERNLPDANMLRAFDFGPYVFPKLLLAWYEPLGYWTFKSITLVVLVVATGLAAYALFRRLTLPWIPSLLLAVVALMPREAAGTEGFGVFTFREAIGRAVAVPVFFLVAGALIRRSIDRRPAWPVFGIVGLLMLLHPSTVMGFAGVALLTVAAVQVALRTPLLVVVRDALFSGIAFVLGGLYFFVEVLARLSRTVPATGVSSADYVAAVLFRNEFEFPAQTFLRYRHLAIVSAVFVFLLVIGFALPAMRRLRERHPLPYEREVTVFGTAMMIVSLTIALALPAVNLYLMEHADWPYVFQQWSRASKFYYLGLFVALVPSVNALWHWYRETPNRFRHAWLALLFTLGLASSTYGFEVVQFAAGYPNFEAGYIPRWVSNVPDDITAEEYRETCRTLSALGGGANPSVVSEDFAFRYYCRADLYTTEEEGVAYSWSSRAEMVEWYAMIEAQRAALQSSDPVKMRQFAERVGARFIIVPRTARYAAFEHLAGHAVAASSRHIVVRVD